MVQKQVKPQPVARRGASEDDLADGSIGLPNSPTLRERQAAHVERRFLLPPPIARIVADIHFAEVQE